MGHSRITLATLLALGLLGTAQAEDSAREPFFVELKGPDEPAPPAVNSQPLALLEGRYLLARLQRVSVGRMGP